MMPSTLSTEIMHVDLRAPVPADDHWRNLVTQISTDVAAPLSAALERVNALAATGRIDRQGLRALRAEIEDARRVGIIGQQLTRVAGGRVRMQPERVNLTQTLRDALLQRSREATSRAIEISQSLGPAQVIVDPTLLYGLIQSLIDWLLARTREHLEFRLDLDPSTRLARLSCRFRHPADHDDPAHTADPDTMSWRLVAQIATTLGLTLDRRLGLRESRVVVGFPRTVNEQVEGLSAVELDAGFSATVHNSKPLAGMHLLIVASRRDVRSAVREALRHMGLVVDFVPTVEEAEHFCSAALPNAIVYEAILDGRRLAKLRESLVAEVPQFVFIEIAEEGRGVQFAGQGESGPTRVFRETIVESLPSALFFELSGS